MEPKDGIGRGVRISLGLAFIALVMLLSMDASLAQVRPSARLEKVAVAMPAYASMFTPLVVAQRRGYYQEEGFATSLLVMRADITIKATIAGSTHYVSTGGSAIDAAVSGAHLRMLMPMTAKPTFDLITQPHIKGFQALKGGGVAVSSLVGSTGIAAREMLLKNGLQPNTDVQIMVIGTQGDRYAALKGGSVRGTLLTSPHNIMAVEEGYHRLAFSGDYVEAVEGGVSTTDQRLRQEPDQVYRFIRASLKGLRSFVEDKKSALPLMAEFLKLRDPRLADRVYDFTVRTAAKDGTIPESIQVQLIQRSREIAKIGREVKPGEVFDFTFVRRAQEELKASGWRP